MMAKGLEAWLPENLEIGDLKLAFCKDALNFLDYVGGLWQNGKMSDYLRTRVQHEAVVIPTVRKQNSVGAEWISMDHSSIDDEYSMKISPYDVIQAKKDKENRGSIAVVPEQGRSTVYASDW